MTYTNASNLFKGILQSLFVFLWRSLYELLCMLRKLLESCSFFLLTLAAIGHLQVWAAAAKVPFSPSRRVTLVIEPASAVGISLFPFNSEPTEDLSGRSACC